MPRKKEKEPIVIISERELRVPAPAKPQNGEKPLPHGVIARRAFELYLARGAKHGSDVEDWLKAEQELCSQR